MSKKSKKKLLRRIEELERRIEELEQQPRHILTWPNTQPAITWPGTWPGTWIMDTPYWVTSAGGSQ